MNQHSVKVSKRLKILRTLDSMRQCVAHLKEAKLELKPYSRAHDPIGMSITKLEFHIRELELEFPED